MFRKISIFYFFMRYFFAIITITALFIHLYKRALKDFRSGYQEGIEIGNALSKKRKRSNKERHQQESNS